MSNVKFRLRSCPLCGTDNRNIEPGPYSLDSWAVKRCPKCGFTYLENVPPYEELDSAFAWEKTSREEETRRKKSRPLLKKLSNAAKGFRKHVLKRNKLRSLLTRYVTDGNILDVGSGYGGTAAWLPERYRLYGIEISRRLAEISNKRFQERGGQVVYANAVEGTQKFDPDFFDCVILSAFLEHEAEPAGLLRGLRRIMKKDAAVIIKLPNFACWNRHVMQRQWSGFRYPDHVNYFTPGSLRRLVEECGFTVERFGFFDRFPLSDNLWMLIRK